MAMLALSIRQPWAWAILYANKEIENRTWPTKYRGRFWIHAGKNYDDAGYLWIRKNFPHLTVPGKAQCPRGGIVGSVELTDCQPTDLYTYAGIGAHSWFFGPFGFKLKDPRPCKFRPCRGMLGFFKIPKADK